MSVVSLTRDGELSVVTFDNPPVNLWTAQLEAELLDVIGRLEAETPRAVLFRAEGKIVSGGVDVSLFAALPDAAAAAEMFTGLISVTHRIEALDCPTVFAAHALCLTWAMEVALACDIILAAESAAFGLVERVIGLTPAMGGTQRLAERAGTGRAKEFVMTGGRFSAVEMERWNVVNRVLPDDGFDAAVREFAVDLAEGPTRAHAATKQILRDHVRDGVPGADAVMPDVAGALFETEDLRAAVRSFLDEGPGKARFSGR